MVGKRIGYSQVVSTEIIEKVAEVYNWLDEQILTSAGLFQPCRACGKCCDFDSFDHRLFITTPEIHYFNSKIDIGNLKPMVNGNCPYNIDGKCSVYEHRFAGCRIFSCKGDSDFQSSLSETALGKVKSLCTDYNIPYRYVDLKTGLNNKILQK